MSAITWTVGPGDNWAANSDWHPASPPYGVASSDTDIAPGHTAAVAAVHGPGTSPVAASSPDQSPALNIAVDAGTLTPEPPDPSIAVGSSSVVTIYNFGITWYSRDGTLPSHEDLYSFFPHGTSFGSDPRVVYDNVNDRFVVAALGDAGTGVDANIEIAVSKTGNPSDGWYFATVGAAGVGSLDYPSLAADGTGIYIQDNAWSGFNVTGTYVGSDLLVVDTGLGTGGFYDGGTITASEYISTQVNSDVGEPVAMLSPVTDSPHTFLYDGAAFGPSGYGAVYVEEVDNPTTNATFVQRTVSYSGGPDASFADFVYPSQPGTSQTITTEFGRNAVWRNNCLYCVDIYTPADGPDAGVLTAHWFRIDTTTWTVIDQGDVSGSQLGSGVATYDPSITADENGDFAINFTASGTALYAGSYYALHLAGDAPGTLRAPQVLHVGLDSYVVAPGGDDHWGDYERSIAADPAAGNDFWMFNEYAAAHTSGGASQVGLEIGEFVACFAQGTRIATPNGMRCVEDVSVGDEVVTVSGGSQAIEWIGCRRIDCHHYRNRGRVWPIRIAPHAFGQGRPDRALLLSPDHSVFVDGVLIPIKFLVNDVTIAQIEVERITYYHIELARHDVVLAEGLPVESYLDCGDRVITLYPDFASRVWESRACAPLRVAGPEVEAARRRLAITASSPIHARLAANR